MPGSRPSSQLDPDAVAGLISRRTLFRRGAGLAAIGMTPALLAACGSSSSSSSADTTGGGAATVGGTVAFLGYQGMDFPTTLKAFDQAHGIKYQSSYINTMDDIPAKFAAGGSSGYDIINWAAPGTLRLSQSKVDFQPLDTERIPNWKNVEQFIEYTGKDFYSNENGEIIAAPICWGALGICYDSAAISAPQTYQELLAPSFKGKLTTVDDPSPNYDQAAIVLGFDSAEMTKDQLNEANEFLKGILANCKKVSPSFGDMASLLASGEAEAAFCGWSAVNTFAAEAGSDTIKTNLEPKEGSALFSEVYGLAPGAENEDTVYALINELLDPKVNALSAQTIFMSNTVVGGQRYQDPAISGLYPKEKDWANYFAHSKQAQDPPAISDQFVTFGELTEAWAQIKTEV